MLGITAPWNGRSPNPSLVLVWSKSQFQQQSQETIFQYAFGGLTGHTVQKQLLCCTFFFLDHKQRSDGAEVLRYFYYFSQTTKTHTMRILCVGDSITAGYTGSTAGIDGGRFFPYANYLAPKLTSLLTSHMNYRGLIAVDQIGVSSATAKMMRDGLAQYDAIQKKNVPTLYHQLETSGPYNLVIIMAGTNDLKDRDVSGCLQDIMFLHGHCHKRGIKTITLPVPDNSFNNTPGAHVKQAGRESYRERWLRLNTELRTWAMQNAMTTYTSPLGSWDRVKWASDGLHLSEYGSRFLGQSLAQHIKRGFYIPTPSLRAPPQPPQPQPQRQLPLHTHTGPIRNQYVRRSSPYHPWHKQTDRPTNNQPAVNQKSFPGQRSVQSGIWSRQQQHRPPTQASFDWSPYSPQSCQYITDKSLQKSCEQNFTKFQARGARPSTEQTDRPTNNQPAVNQKSFPGQRSVQSGIWSRQQQHRPPTQASFDWSPYSPQSCQYITDKSLQKSCEQNFLGPSKRPHRADD